MSGAAPVEEFMLEGFQVEQGEGLLHEHKHLHLAPMLRVIDNKQVNFT